MFFLLICVKTFYIVSISVFYSFFFFFFQAEDGIRDWSVTGVQTCALPIYLWPPLPLPGIRVVHSLAAGEHERIRQRIGRDLRLVVIRDMAGLDGETPRVEIGRASCRERV